MKAAAGKNLSGPSPAKKTSKAPIAPKKAKIGRPSSFTAAIAAKICARIAEGESLRTICKDTKMPGQTTVFAWLAINEEFQKQYALAREQQADKYAAEIIEISDDGKNDTYRNERGEVVTDNDVIARSRLRVDARKWYASKLAPKKYGDKLENTLVGDPEKPLAIDVNLAPNDAYLRMIGKK
jgi:hypothetical protein